MFGMRMRLFLVGLLATGSPAMACPYCDSEVGKQVAAGIFSDAFGWNVVSVMSPIAILLLIVLFIHYGSPRTWKDKPQPAIDRHTQDVAAEKLHD
jgi:hypothetical protein